MRGQLAMGYRSGSTSEWQLKLSGGAWMYEGDGRAQDARLFAALFGWRGVAATRFVISSDAGVPLSWSKTDNVLWRLPLAGPAGSTPGRTPDEWT